MRSVMGIVGTAALMALAGAANATIVDLTAPMSSGTVNGALFETADFRAAGTGLIQSFVRVQANGTEQGYNTSGRPLAFNENSSPNFTRNLTYGDIPTRVIGGVSYKEFILDINQTSATSLLSLDRIQIYSSAVGSQTTSNVSSLGALVYDLDAGGDSWIRLDYNLASGSGQGDMRMFVPVSAFGSITGNTFIYLYSFFGTNLVSNDGFEEWAVQSPTDIVPLPPAALAGGALLVGLAGLRLRNRR
jgi:hypothetical protein